MFLIGGVMGIVIAVHCEQRSAIKAGAAHWTVNQDGETSFIWNTNLCPTNQ